MVQREQNVEQATGCRYAREGQRGAGVRWPIV